MSDMDFEDVDIDSFEEEWPAEPELPIEPTEPQPELPIEPTEPTPELPIEPSPVPPVEPSPRPPGTIIIPPPIWWLQDPWDYWYPSDYPQALYQSASLAITSFDTVRLRVVDADRRTLYDTKMEANQSLRWQGQAPFAISVGDVAAITLYYQDVKVDLSKYPQGQASYFQVPANQ
jgi:hypothetical protein